MKKLMMLAGLSLAGVAGAQSWDTQLGKLTLVGCHGERDGVYCDFSFLLTKQQTAKVFFKAESFKVFGQDGIAKFANSVAAVDGKFDTSWVQTPEIIAGVPVKVQAYFNVPSNISSFRVLAWEDTKFENIPVRPYGTPPKGTPAPLPAPNVTGFSVSLSNCQLQGQNYVCTAILTPTK